MRFVTRSIPLFAVLAFTPAATACSDSTSPSNSDGGAAAGSAVVTVDSALGGGGTTRIEIELFPGELVAREVHVEDDDAEEKLVSVATAIDPAQGTVTLELGGLAVSYGAGTRFRTETQSQESRATWEALVESEIAAGRRPLVEARRNPSAAPQAPDDASFTAADLRLESGLDEPKIEIYVDGDNLGSVSGSTAAVLRVLGLSITVNGRTSLGPDDDGGQGAPGGSGVEFEMGVASVDAAAGTLTLSNGSLVRVTSSTTIDPAGDLFTLESAATAVAQGRPVRAEGRGTVESAGPPSVILASTLKVEVDD
ncbi:MAG TPA: hypothetical protein VG500_04700 [Gemmatimonadales bacterium]|nr:hypothetical protein [Gemmatimonadales bacterium]